MQCLWNDDITDDEFDEFFSLPLPGEMIDIDDQCKYVYGPESLNCLVSIVMKGY